MYLVPVTSLLFAAQVLAEYMSAKAAAANDRTHEKVGATPKHSNAAAPNDVPATMPSREAAPKETAPVVRPSTMPAPEASKPRSPARVPKQPGSVSRSNDDLMVQEVEELEDLDLNDNVGISGNAGLGAYAKAGGTEDVAGRPISMAEAGELKRLVFGNAKLTFNSAWKQVGRECAAAEIVCCNFL